MASIERYRRYLQKLLEHPPQVTAQKVQRRLRTKVKQSWERERARRFSTHLSDRVFAQALDPRFGDLTAFLAHMSRRTTPRFFIDQAHRATTVALLRRHAPEQEPLIIAAADQACAHIFDLLGSGPVALGPQIDWHCDFKSGHRWAPQQYFADVRSAPAPGGYDLKMPWELSRCQHFVWLGQAYWLTGAEKYSEEFVAQVQDWIAQNPPQLGVNWGCAMDVAIRAVNWLWGYAFFQGSPALTPAFQLTFFKSLLAHGRHLRANLEWSETLTSNHYLSDIVGLVYLGMLLPEFKEAAEWRSFGLRELENEMAKQVYADGVDFEASVSYHRLALELFLSPTLLAQRNGHEFSPAYWQRLAKMLAFTAAITKPDGTAPLFGDNDNGRLHRLKLWAEPVREWDDYRYLLAIGALLFDRADLAQAAGEEWAEAIWFWGERVEVARRQEYAPAQSTQSKIQNPKSKIYPAQSQAFVNGGIYLMRHGDHYLAVEAGSNGQNGNGGHAHNDTLSFELYALGQSWLVDPGAYLYTADFAARNLFRSTAYHNTVCVDEQEQHPFAADSLFRLGNDRPPTIHAWQSTPQYDWLDGSDWSYARLKAPVVHRRQFYFDKTHLCWIIRDELSDPTASLGAAHDLLWSWHFAAGLTLDPETATLVAHSPQGGALRLWLLDGEVSRCTIEEGWVSPGYGLRTAAPIVRYRQRQVTLPYQLTVAYLPAAQVTPAETSQGLIAQAYEQFLKVVAAAPAAQQNEKSQPEKSQDTAHG